ncbi:hypothetical protein NDA17_000618 [Ustilago hordei]|nr:hypothetical protein NDA17_000618 [Ustilago hordei]
MSDDSKFSSFNNICAHQDAQTPTPSHPPLRAPIIIFTSQGADFIWAFEPILHLAAHQPELASFLSLALHAVRVELQSVANRRSGASSTTEAQSSAEVELLAILPPFEPFSDLETLVNFHRRTGLKDSVINGVLLCVLQTACVVALYCAAQRGDVDNEDAQAVLSDLRKAWKAVAQPCSQLLGFCTGALSAFSLRNVVEEDATASSFNIWTYAQEAIKTTRVCFWISLRSAQARDRLIKANAPPTPFDHWSIVVSFKAPDSAERVYQCLAQFNMLEQERPLHEPVSLTITARAVNQVSIGGPPHSLERFMAYLSEHMRADARAFPLEIFSPYHTPDLKVEANLVMLDLERRGLVDDTLLPPSQKILWETASAEILSKPSLRGALHALIDSNLCSTADWDTMVDRLLLLEGELPAPTPTDHEVVVSIGPGVNLAADLKKRFSSQCESSPATDTITILDVPVLLREMMRHDAEMLGPERCTLQPDVSGDDVVIVSMACRFPGDVCTPEQLWTCLETGRSTVSEIPKHLFDIDAYYGDGLNQTLARHMHALSENVVKSMDARLFSMSPKEIEQLDPQHRLVMLCSYEALERAGYSAEAKSPSCFDGKRIAVCMGASWDDYRENASWNIGSYFITGNIRAFIPGHVSFSLKWEGPSVSVDSLECSAVSAIQWSRRALLSGQCDAALAGAVNVLTQPQMFIAMDKQGILSHSGTNMTFSSKLDGKTRGDGCGVLLLKRRSTAIRDGDKILATLPAAKITYHGQSFDGEAASTQQSDFLARVFSEAGLQPSDLVHIEASGFHSKEGEAAEFQSFARLLDHATDRSARQSAQKEHDVSVASLRPNIGAGEAVSAMTSVIKAVLILNKGIIPRQVSISHSSELQPAIAATCCASKLFVPTEAKLLPAPRGRHDRRHILVNSLASTGCHGVMLVGSPMDDGQDQIQKRQKMLRQNQPKQAREQNQQNKSQNTSQVQNSSPKAQKACDVSPMGTGISDDECAWVFVLSAKTKESGEMLKKSLIDYLQRDACLADLSYTLACRRTHYPFRLSVIAAEQDELIRRLRGAEFIEARPSGDLPAFHFEFRSPSEGSLPLMKPFIRLTWALRDRSEEFVAFLSSLGATEEEKNSPKLVQICLATVLQNCGISPALVTGDNEIGTLFFQGLIDNESMLGAAYDVGERTLHHAIKHTCDDNPVLDEKLLKTGFSLSRGAGRQTVLDEAKEPTRDLTGTLSVVVKAGEQADPGRNYCSIVITDTVALSDDQLHDHDKKQDHVADPQALQRSLLFALGRLYQQGYNVSWIEYFRPYLPCLKHVDTLPTYPFHLQQFWLEYHDRNLIQHSGGEEDDSSAAQDGELDGVEGSNGGAADLVPDEPLTQPLLSTQTRADSGLRIYISDLKDEIQAALLQVASSSAMSIELMTEAAIESSASSNVPVDGVGGRTLILSHVLLYGELRNLLTAQEARLAVAFRGQRQDCHGDGIQLRFDAKPDAFGECEYQWLDSRDVERQWARLQSLLREKIDSIKNSGEMLGSRLIYKSIGGDFAKSSRSIRSVHFETRSKEAVFCIDGPTPDSSMLAAGQCVLALVVSTLEECARWHHTNFNANADGQYGVTAIGELVIQHEWLECLKQARKSTSSFTAFVSPAQAAGLVLGPDDALVIDMVLFDDKSHIVGELTSVRLARVESTSNMSTSKSTTHLAPVVANETQPAAPAAPVPKTNEPKAQPAAKKASTMKRSSAAEDVHAKITAVLASELGIAVEELKPSVKFADLGLDSLMSLVCISTLEALNLGFDIPQSLFLECDSPEELLAWIREQVGDADGDNTGDLGPDDDSVPDITETAADPAASSPGSTQAPAVKQASNVASPAQGNSAVEEAMKTIITTIETELGVAGGSIDQDANLADLGMDSLMSLLVLGNLSGMLPFELPSSLFMDCTSLGEICAFLVVELGGGNSIDTTAAPPQASVPAQISPPTFAIPSAKPPVLLRKPTTPTNPNSTPLFLLPDGSGMSTVYQFLHPIDRAVYSINSPFLSNASAWNGGITQIAHYYLSCIRLVQPSGPWLVGGWSFGGMVAFEISRILATTPGGKDDWVAGLFLLDTPSPVYPPLPLTIVDWINSAEEVKDIAPSSLPEKLVAHFSATLGSLVGWNPTSLSEVREEGKVPKTWFVVADNQLPGKIEDIREINETVRWLFVPNRATQNGSDGWERFIPPHKITVEPVSGANHFTMVREPAVEAVARVLQEACGQALQA